MSAAVLTFELATDLGSIAHGLFANDLPLRIHGAKAREYLVSRTASLSCRLDLEISGGTFEPDYCAFEIVVGGPDCGDAVECKPQYAVNLESSRPAPEEIVSVSLSDIREFESGTYRFDPNLGTTDFKGRLIGTGAVSHHLLRGTLTLDRDGGDEVHVTLNVEFANDVTVRGSGPLEVKRVYAP